MSWEMIREALVSLPDGMPPPLPGYETQHTLIRGDGEPVAQLTIIRPIGEPVLEFLLEHHNPQDPELFDIHIAEPYPFDDPTTPFNNPFVSWEVGQIPDRDFDKKQNRKDSGQASSAESTPLETAKPTESAPHRVGLKVSRKMASNKPSPIVEFYDPEIQGGDVRGRKLNEILEWKDEQLEMSHDYIQWLFPLPEESVFNYNAPVVTEEVADAFRKNLELRHRMGTAFERMMNFYGYEVLESGIVRGPNWNRCSRRWCRPSDHNHLRITRILRSLRVLGMQTQCDAFWKALQDTYNDPNIKISPTSMKFWQRAVQQPLYIAPDGERVDWLKKYELDAKEETNADTKA